MQNKRIFENYKDKCPICGGDLDSTHQFCPYCGSNLSSVNQEHRDNESIIAEAIDDIDEAKRKLAYREKQYRDNKRGKDSLFAKIAKWIVIFGIVNFALLLIIGLIITAVEDAQEQKIEEFKQSLLAQDVDIEKYNEIDLDDYDFLNTNKQSSAGYIQEADGVFAIPFYSDLYSSNGIFKGTIYIDSDNFDEFSLIYEDRISIYYNDCYLSISTNDGYYQYTVDALPLYDKERIEMTRRLDNIKIGDIVFECYQVSEDFVMVSNPFADCYITIEGSPSYDNDNFEFDDMMKVLRIDCDLELK